MRCGTYGFTDKDSYLSYLPLAHSFEQALFATAITFGAKIGYYGGDLLKMTSDDLPALKPTIFPSVPRLYNKIYAKIKMGMDSATGVKGWLVNKAFNSKLAGLKNSNVVTSGCYDAIVFKKMKAIMGG